MFSVFFIFGNLGCPVQGGTRVLLAIPCAEVHDVFLGEASGGVTDCEQGFVHHSVDREGVPLTSTSVRWRYSTCHACLKVARVVIGKSARDSS